MESFQDKVVVITGAGGGLGRAHALEFARVSILDPLDAQDVARI